MLIILNGDYLEVWVLNGDTIRDIKEKIRCKHSLGNVALTLILSDNGMQLSNERDTVSDYLLDENCIVSVTVEGPIPATPEDSETTTGQGDELEFYLYQIEKTRKEEEARKLNESQRPQIIAP